MKPHLFCKDGRYYVQSGIVALGFATQGEAFSIARLYWDALWASVPTCNAQDRPVVH